MWLGPTTGTNAINDIDSHTGKVSPYVGSVYQNAIIDFVSALNANGITADVGLFYVSPGTVQADSSRPMADADHAIAFWTSVANTFKNNQSVMFDPYNEPTITSSIITDGTTPWNCWLNGCMMNYPGLSTPQMSAGMQQMVNAIRSTGAAQPIILGGLTNASDPCGITNKNGDNHTCSITAYMPTDPDHQLMVDFHVYDTFACYTASCLQSTLTDVNAAGYPLVPTEFGEADCNSQYLTNTFFPWADAGNESYLAWAWVPPDNAPDACVSGTGYNYSLLYSYDGAPNTYPGYSQATTIKNHYAESAVISTEK